MDKHAQPAGAGAPSIDTPEFRDLLEGIRVLNVIEGSAAVKSLISHIDAQLARQGAAPTQAEPVAGGYVLMPKRLTAENGAKGALSGEFKESISVKCHECDGSGEDDEFDSACVECKGTGALDQNVPVSWDTIKDIYKAAVGLLATAPAQAGVAQAADAQDAARWREAMMHIGGAHYRDASIFAFRYMKPIDGDDLMRGSVAGHFTRAIDAAIQANASNTGGDEG